MGTSGSLGGSAGRPLRLLFVWPPGNMVSQVLPLGIATLRANLPRGSFVCGMCDLSLNPGRWQTRLADMMRSFEPGCVAISTWSVTMSQALAVAALLRQKYPSLPVVLGGLGVSVLAPERLAALCDRVGISGAIRGEAERSLPTLLAGLAEDGSCQEAGLVEDLDTIRPPDFGFIDLHGYLARNYRYHSRKRANAPLVTTRGCPYRCKFCSAPELAGRRLRKHSADYLEEEIQRLYRDFGIRHINIIDDNFTFESDFAKELCQRILRMRRPDLSFGSPNGVRLERLDDELLRMMRACGWRHLVVAPESGSSAVLQSVGKSLKLDLVADRVRAIRRAGLFVHGFFVVGFPAETEETLRETERMVLDTPFDTISIFRFQPLPGTRLFRELVASGEIAEEFEPGDFNRPTPGGYTPPALADGQLEAMRKRMMLRFYARPTRAVAALHMIGARRALEVLGETLRLGRAG